MNDFGCTAKGWGLGLRVRCAVDPTAKERVNAHQELIHHDLSYGLNS